MTSLVVGLLLSFPLIVILAGILAGRLLRGGGVGLFGNIAVGIAGGLLFGLAPSTSRSAGLVGAPIAAAVGASVVLLRRRAGQRLCARLGAFFIRFEQPCGPDHTFSSASAPPPAG